MYSLDCSAFILVYLHVYQRVMITDECGFAIQSVCDAPHDLCLAFCHTCMDTHDCVSRLQTHDIRQTGQSRHVLDAVKYCLFLMCAKSAEDATVALDVSMASAMSSLDDAVAVGDRMEADLFAANAAPTEEDLESEVQRRVALIIEEERENAAQAAVAAMVEPSAPSGQAWSLAATEKAPPAKAPRLSGPRGSVAEAPTGPKRDSSNVDPAACGAEVGWGTAPDSGWPEAFDSGDVEAGAEPAADGIEVGWPEAVESGDGASDEAAAEVRAELDSADWQEEQAAAWSAAGWSAAEWSAQADAEVESDGIAAAAWAEEAEAEVASGDTDAGLEVGVTCPITPGAPGSSEGLAPMTPMVPATAKKRPRQLDVGKSAPSASAVPKAATPPSHPPPDGLLASTVRKLLAADLTAATSGSGSSTDDHSWRWSEPDSRHWSWHEASTSNEQDSRWSRSHGSDEEGWQWSTGSTGDGWRDWSERDAATWRSEADAWRWGRGNDSSTWSEPGSSTGRGDDSKWKSRGHRWGGANQNRKERLAADPVFRQRFNDTNRMRKQRLDERKDWLRDFPGVALPLAYHPLTKDGLVAAVDDHGRSTEQPMEPQPSFEELAESRRLAVEARESADSGAAVVADDL